MTTSSAVSLQPQHLLSRRSITGNTDELFFVDSVEGAHLLVMLVEQLVRSLELNVVESIPTTSNTTKNLCDGLREDAASNANFK